MRNMIVYRLSKKKYENDISGSGSIQYPGRWNMEGTQMLYTSETSSLAILEVAVHFRTILKIEQYSIIVIEVPKKYLSITKLYAEELPDKWDEYPLISETRQIGTDWVQYNKSLLLTVPSAINPYEQNILINPNHPDFQNIKIINKQPLS
ncbi:MAG: RES family NAD+ phosphorylase [Spirochaetales bacterium]|nr:RES family NAD+ phosphorylase [Spirochaetales bacterium]